MITRINSVINSFTGSKEEIKEVEKEYQQAYSGEDVLTLAKPKGERKRKQKGDKDNVPVKTFKKKGTREN